MEKVNIKIDVTKTAGEIPKEVAGIMTDPPKPEDHNRHLVAAGGDQLFPAEAFVPVATSRLKSLQGWMTDTSGEQADAVSLYDWVSPKFSCSLLRPRNRQMVYQNTDYEVWRSGAPQSGRRHLGFSGLRTALSELREPFAENHPTHGVGNSLRSYDSRWSCC